MPPRGILYSPIQQSSEFPQQPTISAIIHDSKMVEKLISTILPQLAANAMQVQAFKRLSNMKKKNAC